MKLLIINNLSSGYGEGAIYDYLRAVIDDGDEVVIRSTDGTTDVREFLRDANEFDIVVASGGDGTISMVAYELADSGIPILPFPAGTANLLSLNLASPTEPHALAKLTREGRCMDFDIGELELADGSHVGFSIMAGAGYDATIMAGAASSKKLLGPMAYFSAALANPTPQFSTITLDIDGRIINSTGVGVLVVNFSKIQFDISVVHDNLPRDGEFDIVILKARDAFGLLPALVAGVLDRSGEFPARTNALEIHRGRNVRVHADPPLHIQYDGEADVRTTPFSIRPLPHAARYLVSEDCAKIYGDCEPENNELG